MIQLNSNSITFQTLLNQIQIKQEDQTYEQLIQQGMEPIQAEIISGNIVDSQLEFFLSSSRTDQNIPVNKIIQQLAYQKIYSYDQFLNIEQNKCPQLNIDLNKFQQAQRNKPKQVDDQFQIYDIKPKAIQSDKKQKSILLLGQTGAGKSTFINLLANYCYCENQNTQYRVRAIKKEEKKKQSESCTEKIETYVFMNRRINEQLVLIDTPGFGDTGGFSVDLKITNELQRLLTQELNQIDMICLVKKESDNRLDATNMYVLGQVFSLFANDMKKNVHLVFTNSQFTKKPQALNLFIDAEEFKKILSHMVDPKLSQVEMGSGALFDKEESDLLKLRQNFDRITQLWNKFTNLQPQSLKLTQQVLITRENLIKLADDINYQLIEQLNQQDFIQKNYNIYGQDQQFIQIEQFSIQTVSLKEGEFVTNCLICRFTCHYPCFIEQDHQKHLCTAMKNLQCTQCINKCEWKLHKNNDYRILYTSHIKPIKSFTIDKNKLIQQYMDSILNYFKKYQVFTNYLKQITNEAMLPRSHLYFNDYILLQIQNEESYQNNGYQERIIQLKQILQIFKKIQEEHNQQTGEQILDLLLNPLEKLIDIDAFKAILESNKKNFIDDQVKQDCGKQ